MIFSREFKLIIGLEDLFIRLYQLYLLITLSFNFVLILPFVHAFLPQSLFHYRHFPQSLSKVHAKVVKHHTQALRRNFVSKNEQAVQAAISRLLPIQQQLSVRDEGFLILAAYLLWQKTKSHELFEVLKAARLKNIAIALAKIARGF